MIILANGRVITRNPGGVGYLPDGGVAADVPLEPNPDLVVS